MQNKQTEAMKKRGKPLFTSIPLYILSTVICTLLTPIVIVLIQRKVTEKLLLSHDLFSMALEEVNFEEKLILIVELLSCVSVFMVFLTALTIINRWIFKNVEPLILEDAKPIVVLNRISTHTIGMSLMTFPLLAYFILKADSVDDVLKLYSLGVVWIIGRVLFGAGYYLGMFVNFGYLRVYGFYLNIGIVLSLVGRFIGFGIFTTLLNKAEAWLN